MHDIARPQNGPDAIAHLCKACGTTQLLHEAKCKRLAEQSSSSDVLSSPLQLWELPRILKDFPQDEPQTGPARKVSETDTAYIHHSSGTSGGLPKPLPISHQLAVGVLPVPRGRIRDFVTLSTTPLYHGGVADCFRSWSAASMIWLFPGTSPVTADNVLRCVHYSRLAEAERGAPRINHFSCVPQVLNIMADDVQAMYFLQDMKTVGVGGAAMPPGLATRLVNDKVSLVSRYGSAECGFLLSSHRDYDRDKAWDFLRQDPDWPLTFEPQSDGLFELVVGPSWPALKHHNRPDGSFATADLFEPHRSIPRAWKFHSRADAQLTLVTGKKFDAAPIEDAIRESPLITDILIFGEGQAFPGAFLFPDRDIGPEEQEAFLNELWPVIESQNRKSPPHARLSKSMLLFLPSHAPALGKSAKGTTQRKPAYRVYEKEIAAAYSGQALRMRSAVTEDDKKHVDDAEVEDVLTSIIQEQSNLSERLQSDDDFFNLGIDSNAALMIRGRIQRQLIDDSRHQLPFNVVYDCGTLSKLSNYIIAFRHGEEAKSRTQDTDEIQTMIDLVDRYGHWKDPRVPFDSDHRDRQGKGETQDKAHGVILLTGATGTLGAHILAQLRASPTKPEIRCLVRGASLKAARDRVDQSLKQRGLRTLDASDDRVHIHPCRLADASLGLDPDVFMQLSRSVTAIIHAAWTVNFTMRLSSFVKDHIAGVHNLINFALLCTETPEPPRFIFCSSTATATGTHSSPGLIHELVNPDPSVPQAMGYPRSKWVAEMMCANAEAETRLRGHIRILRIGQLCGDTQRGIWNVTEAWPLMLSSSRLTESLPDLGDEPLDWLPVDIAAQAVLEVARSGTEPSNDVAAGESGQPSRPCRAYNILNTSQQATWRDLFQWLHKLSPDIEIIPSARWISQLDDMQREGKQHPAMKLLDMWHKSYCDPQSTVVDSPRLTWHMDETKRMAPVMQHVMPIGEEQFGKIWEWLQRETADN